MRKGASTWLATAIVATWAIGFAHASARAHSPGPQAEPELTAQMTPFYVGAIASNMKVSLVYRTSASTQRRLYSLLVREVRSKSSAEKAGLLAGMEIVKIEGVPIDGLYEDELDNLLHRPLAEFLNLTVTPVHHDSSTKTFSIQIPLPKPPEASVVTTADAKASATPAPKSEAATKK